MLALERYEYSGGDVDSLTGGEIFAHGIRHDDDDALKRYRGFDEVVLLLFVNALGRGGW